MLQPIYQAIFFSPHAPLFGFPAEANSYLQDMLLLSAQRNILILSHDMHATRTHTHTRTMGFGVASSRGKIWPDLRYSETRRVLMRALFFGGVNKSSYVAR